MFMQRQDSNARIIVFDGVCHVCSGGVGFLARHRIDPPFELIPMQSAEGKGLLGEHQIDAQDPGCWHVTAIVGLGGAQHVMCLEGCGSSSSAAWGISARESAGALRKRKVFKIIATSRHAGNTPSATNVELARLDIEQGGFAEQLQSLAPDLVIHCAGPFQNQDNRVALAALRSGAHYIDIADGRAFVAGFVAAVHPAADAAGRLAITGASTLPALSSAVVDSMHKSQPSINSIEIFIAPGQRAPRGVATMTAVLGYAGEPIPWWQDGAWRIAHGWQELKERHFHLDAD
jgi:saccharopine dehydrogenase-like NADP-dependent oxidoreductase